MILLAVAMLDRKMLTGGATGAEFLSLLKIVTRSSRWVRRVQPGHDPRLFWRT